jgi:uncharacterized protein YecE (DUF72 family)
VLLAQFPPSFKRSAESRGYLEWLLSTFRDYPLAVELRHSSWSDAVGDTLALLNGLNAAWVQIDEPKFRFSIRQNLLPNISTFYYMRLHGRNAAAWWRHGATEDRYDYLYTKQELAPFAETAVAARALVKKAYLYMNNHFAGKSVANAVMLRDMVGSPVTADFPATFVRQFPEVGPLVATAKESFVRSPS